MGYYSDPTASRALGNINREFSKFEKRAKLFKKLRDEGKISPEALAKKQEQFRGLYRHVLEIALAEEGE